MTQYHLIKSEQIKIKNTLSNLSNEDSEYFTELLNQRASDIFKNSQNEQELTELKKKKAQLETAISNQVKNMRDAGDDLKRFIQKDIQDLSNELREIGILPGCSASPLRRRITGHHLRRYRHLPRSAAGMDGSDYRTAYIQGIPRRILQHRWPGFPFNRFRFDP